MEPRADRRSGRHFGFPSRAQETLALIAFALGVGAAATAGGDKPPAGVSAPGYCTRYLARPNPLQIANGLALDDHGTLYIDRVLRNSIVKLDLSSHRVTEIASDSDPIPQQLQGPDDMAFDAAGNLYVTEFLGRQVARVAPDGTRTQLGFVTDGFTAPNGIAFRGARLFVSDLTFDPSRPGGIWEVDPTGATGPHPVLFQQLASPEAFAFGADGLAYVPEFFAGNIAVVDVDAPSVVRRIHVGGILSAIKFDHHGRIVVLQADTGRVLRGSPDALQVVAEGAPGLDNVVVGPGDALIVSNYILGNVYTVDERHGRLVPLTDGGPLAFPVSLAPSATDPDAIWVANFSSVARLDDGTVQRVASLFLDGLSPEQPTLFTAGVVESQGALFYSDALPPIDERITQLVQVAPDGTRTAFAHSFALPTHVRPGPGGALLFLDQVAGMLAMTDGSGGLVPLQFGLQSPAGLAWDAASNTAYVSESAAGRVDAISLNTLEVTTAASGLTDPEGVTLDGRGGLLIVEGDAGRLSRVDAHGHVTVVATGLPTHAVGPTIIPGFNLSSDVMVQSGGRIVVSGDGDGSVIQLDPRPGCRGGRSDD